MAKKRPAEGRLITRPHFPQRKYHMSKEPAYWTALILLVFAGFMLVTFSDIQPPESIMAAPQLNTFLGLKVTTLFIIFVIAAAIAIIALVAVRMSKHAREEHLNNSNNK